MQWSLRLGRVNGVPVEAHWLLALLVGWVAYTGWASAGLAGLVSNTALLVAGFACILVHEIAHTLQAQAINLPVRRIGLLPFGGLAQLGRLPERPPDELRIALAGPLVNLGLGLIFAALRLGAAGAHCRRHSRHLARTIRLAAHSTGAAHIRRTT